MDGADVCRTSSRASRRPPDVISTAAILDSRWWCRKWRHPEPGASFSIPIAAAAQDGGPSASGRHLGWPRTGNEVIQDGGRKRKGRHLAPPPQWGSKNSPYTTDRIGDYADGLVQDCIICFGSALEIPQSCTKLSMHPWQKGSYTPFGSIRTELQGIHFITIVWNKCTRNVQEAHPREME